MMPLLRRTKRRMKTGACIVMACYILFLLAVVWMAGEGNLANQAGHLGIFNTDNDRSRQKKIKDSSGIWGDNPRAAWLPETLDRALQQQPWKLPVRRKLSKPDSQQPNVVVEEAPPGTFAREGYSDDTPFEDLESPNRSRITDPPSLPRITDPRSLDWLLAGSPVDNRRGTPRKSNHGDVEEDSGYDDTDPKKKDSEENDSKLRTWVAPDGAVESQRETETDAVSSENAAHEPDPQHETRNRPKDSAAGRSTDTPHTTKPVPVVSSRNLPPTKSNLLSKVSAARSTDPNKKTPQPKKTVPVSSRNLHPTPSSSGKVSSSSSAGSTSSLHTPPPKPNPVSVSASKQQPPTPQAHRPNKPVPTLSSSSSKLLQHHHQHPAAAQPSSSSSSNFSVSGRTANFVEIADLVIYSAFYDDRLRVPLVRLLGVGPVTRRSPAVRLWCVFGSASAEPAPVSVHQSADCKRSRRRKYCFYMFHCQIPDRLQKTSSSLSSVVVVASKGKDTSSTSHPGERVRLSVILNTNATTRHDRDIRSASGSATTTTTTRHVGDVRSAAGSSITRHDNNVRSASGPVSSTRHDHDVRSASGSSAATSKTLSSSPTFSVCVVPPLFGKLTVLQIVEFVELNRLLGASHFVFYTFRVSREVAKVLSYYEQAGVVSAMPWNIPAPNDVWNKGESVSMADCLYRSMHIFDYVVFLDMNEYFVPNQGATWPTFIMERVRSSAGSSKKLRTAAYEISPVKIYPNATLVNLLSSSKTTVKSETSKFLTLRNTLRGQASSANVTTTTTTTKLVLKPERVLGVDSQSLVQPISEVFVSQKVDPHLASVFRFTPKVCSPPNNSEAGSFAQSCDKLYEDRTIWRYKNALLERTKHVLRTLNQQADSKLT